MFKKLVYLIATLTLTCVLHAIEKNPSWSESELKEFSAQRAIWKSNKIGVTAGVMKPWVPLKIEGTAVECLLRRYIYSGTLFPGQIESCGQRMFGDAPWIELTLDSGRILRFRNGEFFKKFCHAEKARIVTSAVEEGISLDLVFDYEFDGLVKIGMRLHSPSGQSARGLRLFFPLLASSSTLGHYMIWGAHPAPPSNWSGDIPEEGFSLDEFRGQLWIGNSQIGFSWFAEGMQGWPLRNEKEIQSLSPVKNGVRLLQIRMADTAFDLGKTKEIVFGIMATPMRTRDPNFRTLPDRRTLVWLWQNWGDGAAHPFDESPEAKKYIAEMREDGRDVMPYSSLHYYGVYRFRENDFGILEHSGMLHPELKLWGPQWVRWPIEEKYAFKLWKPVGPNREVIDTKNPEHDFIGENFLAGRFNPKGLVEICPNSEFQDFYLWKLQQTVRATGLRAIYFDGGVAACANAAHGCGYYDANGKWRPSAPLWATREMLKRIKKLFMETFGESRICLHESNQIVPAFQSFCDIHLDAEMYAYAPIDVHEFYSKLITPGMMLTTHTGNQFGWAPEFLPVFNFFWRDYRAPSPASIRDLCGLCFVHDVTVSPKDTRFNELINFYQNKRFQYFPECGNVSRYWDANSVLTIQPANVKGIIHYGQKKALFIVFNWSDDIVDARINVDLSRLPEGESYTMMNDVVGGECLPLNSGQCTVFLAPRDFRMFELLKSAEEK